MPICVDGKNSREEYLRTKIGYIKQWQTPVDGNSNQRKKEQKSNVASQASHKPG